MRHHYTSGVKRSSMALGLDDMSAALGKETAAVQQQQVQQQLSFDDARLAFESKSTLELMRAAVIFKACRSRALVKNSSRLIKMSYNVLGKNITNAGLRLSFFGHFCGGENANDIVPKVSELQKSGIGSILDFAAEADVEDPRDLNGVPQSQVSARTYDYEGEKECDDNAQVAMQAIRDAASSTNGGFTAIKLTAMGKPDLLARMSSILVESQRMFRTLDAPNLSKDKISYLKKVIDYPTLRAGIVNSGIQITENEVKELFSKMDAQNDGFIDYLDWLSFLDPMDLTMGPLTQFFEIPPLDEQEKAQLANMIHRLEKLASAASESNVKLMIDAEQTYMQAAIDHIVLNLQRKYNLDGRSIIYNTFQCYLVDSADRIHIDLERGKRENFMFACKLVRGAYMVQERKRAKDLGYSDPIHPSIEATHQNYDAMIKYLLDNNHLAHFMVASHNEESVQTTLKMMNERNISKLNGGVYFGQLLGMCDHVSYTLGHAGYNVFKYVPYGPIELVVPYLVRRAEENSDIMLGATKETMLLHKEIKRRIMGVPRIRSQFQS